MNLASNDEAKRTACTPLSGSFIFLVVWLMQFKVEGLDNNVGVYSVPVTPRKIFGGGAGRTPQNRQDRQGRELDSFRGFKSGGIR